MKKLIGLFLVILAPLVILGCSDDKGSDQPQPQTQQTQQTQQAQ